MIYKSLCRRIFFFFCGGVLMAVLIQSCSGSGSTMSTKPVAPESDCHMVRHALGETCVPNQPLRVITLSVPSLGNAIALGLTPIATTVYFDEPQPYLAEHLKSIEVLGQHEQPNLERIMALKPDLIIGMSASIASTYPLLSQVAPTVADDWDGYPSWRRHFAFVAKVLGKTESAQQIWRRYEQRVQSLQTALQEKHLHPEVSFVHTCCGTIDLDLADSFNGSIMADVGLRRPPNQALPLVGGMLKLSQERLMDIDGDVLFIAADGDTAARTLNQHKDSPVWQKLRAVQSERVYTVNYPTWRGGNPLAAEGVIDDLFNHLVEPTPPT